MFMLKFLRLERNLFQKDVARELNISQQAYANYENSLREPDTQMLKKIASFFDVSIDTLLITHISQSRLNDFKKIVFEIYKKRC